MGDYGNWITIIMHFILFIIDSFYVQLSLKNISTSANNTIEQPSDIAQRCQESPVQPSLKFLCTTFGGKKRSLYRLVYKV